MPLIWEKSKPDHADMTAVRAFSAADIRKSPPDHAGMIRDLPFPDLQRTADHAGMKNFRFQMARE